MNFLKKQTIIISLIIISVGYRLYANKTCGFIANRYGVIVGKRAEIAYYNVYYFTGILNIMEKVAEKRFKKIGGDYDYDSTIKLLIQDFRTQKFGLITLDNYSNLIEDEEQNEN